MPEALKELERVCDHWGLTGVAVQSKLVEWFVKQPDLIQAKVMGHLPDDPEGSVARLVLKRMAEQPR